VHWFSVIRIEGKWKQGSKKGIRTVVENWAKAITNVDRHEMGHHSSDIVMFNVPAPLR